MHPLDVVADVAADLDLQPVKALADDALGMRRHRIDRAMGDHLVELGRIAVAPAEQGHQRHVGGARGKIPAGHVERRLDVGMALEHGVHQPRDLVQRARILADEMRRDLGDAGARACREGRRIEIAERRHLAPAGQAVVGGDGDDDRIEGIGAAALRHVVGPVDEGLQHAVGFDGFDAHLTFASACRLLVTS